MERFLINCDLGENEPDNLTAALMAGIDAANICCGVHAGGIEKMARTVQLAIRHRVLIGAHPGMATLGGRGPQRPSPETFDALLEHQLEHFRQAVEAAGAAMHHIKLHGTLYHAVEEDEELAEVYLRHLKNFPGTAVFCLAGGAFAKKARAAALPVFEEIFADRAYGKDATLLPRELPGAVLTDPTEAARRMRKWMLTGLMETADGEAIPIQAHTICVHSDSPSSALLLSMLRGEE